MRKFIAGFISIICFQFPVSENPGPESTDFSNERVDFSLNYGFLKIGDAHLEFSFDQKCSGALIHVDAKTSGLLKLFKDIHFRYECCMDTLTGLPVSDSRILIEDDYADLSTVYYDHVSRKDSSLIYSKKTGTRAVPKNIYDILSGFYHYRTNHLGERLELDQSVTTTTFFIDEIWDLTIRYCGKEVINSKYGPVNCLKVKPVTVVGHFFQTTDAMTIWFADNGEFIPVKFSIELRIGTLHGNITDYKSKKAINEMRLEK